MNITLVADNREKLSGIPGMLANKGADVTMMQLATGDYMINDEIIIERKTSTDFVASIINGRLLKQCAGLRKTKMIPLIIVEGNPFQTGNNIKPEALKGVLLSVSLQWQIPVIRSSGKNDTANLILMAAKQTEFPSYFVKRTGRKPKRITTQRHFLVQNMPGVGPAIAHRLLAHFKTIKGIISANVKSLQTVEGIGKGKANKLFEFFRMESK